MLLGIHSHDSEADAFRSRLASSADWPRLRRLVQSYLAGENAFSAARPGPPKPAPLTVPQMSPLAHGASALSSFHAVEPTPAIETVLRNFLLWTLDQEVMLLYGAFLQGQFLRGVILALDAVGETIPDDQRRAILEHLIRTAVEDPDPSAAVNNRPDRNAPLRRTLEIPGTGFHVKDEQVNNWDLLGAMGLLYVARATDALLPGRKSDVEAWIGVARRRAERFFRLQYTDEGEYGEGPGYYSYATTGAVHLLDMLQRWNRVPWWKDLATRGLHASPSWSREMHPREVVHGPFNVNDSHLGMLESPSLVHWIVRRTKDPGSQRYGDELREITLAKLEADLSSPEQSLEGVLYSLLWRDDTVAAVCDRRTSQKLRTEHDGHRPPLPDTRRSRCFGRFGTVISRSGYTSDDVCLFFRSGAPAGAHSHADRGTFLLTAYGENLVSEGGRPIDRAACPDFMTFHHEVWAHNCAMPAGQPQKRELDGRYLQGRILGFVELPDGVFVRADNSQVYPGAGKVERTVRFWHRGWLLVHDFIEKPGEAVEFLLHTDNRDRKARLTIEPARTLIQRPKATLVVVPLLGGEVKDTGTHWQDGDREGLRSLVIRRSAQEMATMLVAVRAGQETRVNVRPTGEREWALEIDGRTETIRLEKEGIKT